MKFQTDWEEGRGKKCGCSLKEDNGVLDLLTRIKEVAVVGGDETLRALGLNFPYWIPVCCCQCLFCSRAQFLVVV